MRRMFFKTWICLCRNGSIPTRAGGNDSSRTFFVTSPGTYRVDVTDPVCGTKSDVAIVTSNAATPVDGTYCSSGSKANLSVTGLGKYKWCSNELGACLKIGAGSNFQTPALTTSSTYTYYLKDTSTFSMKTGPIRALVIVLVELVLVLMPCMDLRVDLILLLV